MLISAFIFVIIIFLFRLSAFVLILPVLAAAAAITAVNIIGLSCGMGIAPLLWDVVTVITAFKSLSLLSADIFLGQSVAVDFYRMMICYILSSVALLIWWMVRELFVAASRQS